MHLLRPPALSVRNSHTPSEARMRNLSLGSIKRWFVSGSELTPTLCASESPSDRLMARPGAQGCRLRP